MKILKQLNMKKPLFIIIVMMIAMMLKTHGQDAHFTQVQYFPLALNPAMSGCNYVMSANAIYRNQWKSVAVPYNTFGFSIDGRLKKSPKGHFLAGGISFYNDNTGDLQFKTNDVKVNLAYHLNLQKGHKLGLGLYGGFIQRSINMGNAQWGAQYDYSIGQYNPAAASNENLGSLNTFVIDAGTGIVYSYTKNEKYMRGNDNLRINAGFSALHVNQPASTFLKNSSDKMYIKYVLFANAEIGIKNTNFAIVPLLVTQMQGPGIEVLAGGYIKYLLQDQSHYTGLKKGSSFSIGSIYRNSDAVTTNFIFEYDAWAIGASYDVNISQLKTVSKGKGAVEVFLRYVLPSPFGPGASKSRI